MLEGLLKSFGIVPDILMGKKPEDAIRDNVIGVTGTLTGAGLLGQAGTAANGAASAVPAATTATPAVPTAAQQGGLLGAMSSYAKQAQPIMQAGSTGMQVANMANQQPKIQQPPIAPIGSGGANQMTSLYQGNQQAYLTPIQQAQAARMQRRNMWG